MASDQNRRGQRHAESVVRDSHATGKAIGSVILKSLLSEAEVQNKAITLGVVKFNPAVRFYERHGFHVTHEDEYKLYMRSKR